MAFKLTKKYDAGSVSAHPIVTIYLTATEFDALAGLPGYPLSKTRHFCEHCGCVFAVDVFHGALEGLMICEIETGDRPVPVPDFARWEVTEDPFFTGGSLSRTSRSDLEAALARLKRLYQSSRTPN